MSKLPPRKTNHGMPLYSARDRQRSPGLSPATRDEGRWESTDETEARRALRDEGLDLHEFAGFGATHTADAMCDDCGLPYEHRLHHKPRVAPQDVVLLEPTLPQEWEPDPDDYVDQDNVSLRRQASADDLHVVTVFRWHCLNETCLRWDCQQRGHRQERVRYSLEVQRTNLRNAPLSLPSDYQPLLYPAGKGRFVKGPSLRTTAQARRQPNWSNRPSPQARTTFLSPGTRLKPETFLERHFPGLRSFDFGTD